MVITLVKEKPHLSKFHRKRNLAFEGLLFFYVVAQQYDNSHDV